MHEKPLKVYETHFTVALKCAKYIPNFRNSMVTQRNKYPQGNNYYNE